MKMAVHTGDFDGDIILTTNQKEMIEGSYHGIPITYAKKSSEKKIVEESELYKADLLAYDPKIGFITNTSSTLYVLLDEMEEKYGKDSDEYRAVLNRLKICRKCQGDTIDSAKGIVVKDFPRWWTEYTKITDDMSEEDRNMYKLSNKIVVDSETRPYFFRYVYDDYNFKYGKKMDYFNEFCVRKYGFSFNEILEDYENNDYEDVMNKYYKSFGFIDNNSVMNLVCKNMEKKVGLIKNFSNYDQNSCFNLLFSENIGIKDDNISKIIELYNKFKKEKSTFSQKNKVFGKNDKIKFKTIDSLFSYIKTEANSISSSSQELANLAVYLCYHYGYSDKDFVWKIFQEGLIENINENKKTKLMFPIICEDGDIEYLGKYYKNVEVDNIGV